MANFFWGNQTRVSMFHIISFNIFWKFLCLGNLALDFLGDKSCSKDFFGFFGSSRDFFGFDFCPHLIIPWTVILPFLTFWKNTFYFKYGIWLIPWPGKIKQILCSEWLTQAGKMAMVLHEKILLCQFFSDQAFSVKITTHMACFCVFIDVVYSCQSIKHNLERISPIRYLTILTSCFKSVTCTHA